ncbi:uncharacterized protein [Palaemon carinicauda]|uniref:uncharacterized protein isoform X3 n=1 Tax=Palaemon carinicauda TaxID=392227 RepID=UPI0035B6819C
MVETNSCCFRFSPRTGTLVIGWLSLIWSVSHVLFMQQNTVFNEGEYKMVCEELVCNSTLKSIGCDICPIIAAIAMSVLIVASVLSVLLVLTNGLLVFGVHQNKPWLMIPYIFYRVMEISTLCVAYLSLAVFGIYIGNSTVIAFTIIIFSLVITLDVYFLLVVIACYKEYFHR